VRRHRSHCITITLVRLCSAGYWASSSSLGVCVYLLKDRRILLRWIWVIGPGACTGTGEDDCQRVALKKPNVKGRPFNGRITRVGDLSPRFQGMAPLRYAS
jgi:hypothetical protein